MQYVVIAIIVAIVVVAALSCIKIVNTGYLYVVERLGQYHRTLEPGMHGIIPFFDFVRKRFLQSSRYWILSHRVLLQRIMSEYL